MTMDRVAAIMAYERGAFRSTPLENTMKATINFRVNFSDWLIGVDWIGKEMRYWNHRRMVCLRFLCFVVIVRWGRPDGN